MHGLNFRIVHDNWIGAGCSVLMLESRLQTFAACHDVCTSQVLQRCEGAHGAGIGHPGRRQVAQIRRRSRAGHYCLGTHSRARCTLHTNPSGEGHHTVLADTTEAHTALAGHMIPCLWHRCCTFRQPCHSEAFVSYRPRRGAPACHRSAPSSCATLQSERARKARRTYESTRACPAKGCQASFSFWGSHASVALPRSSACQVREARMQHLGVTVSTLRPLCRPCDAPGVRRLQRPQGQQGPQASEDAHPCHTCNSCRHRRAAFHTPAPFQGLRIATRQPVQRRARRRRLAQRRAARTRSRRRRRRSCWNIRIRNLLDSHPPRARRRRTSAPQCSPERTRSSRGAVTAGWCQRSWSAAASRSRRCRTLTA